MAKSPQGRYTVFFDDGTRIMVTNYTGTHLQRFATIAKAKNAAKKYGRKGLVMDGTSIAARITTKSEPTLVRGRRV